MWACTRPLQSVHAKAELVCRGRVVVLVSCVTSTTAVGRVRAVLTDIFSFFFSMYCCIGMRTLANNLPSVKIPNFGKVKVSCFSCFSWEKKEENLEKKSCLIRTALTLDYFIIVLHIKSYQVPGNHVIDRI